MDNNGNQKNGIGITTGIVLVVLLLGVGFGFTGCGGDASVVGYLNSLESRIASSVKGGKGAVVATVEGSPIYKGVFDRKFDMFVDNLPVEPAKKVQVKSSSKMMLQFLNGLVESEVLLKSLKDDSAFLNDPDFLVYLSLKTMQTVQEYYILKKIEGKVDQSVSKEQYDDAYKQLKANPRYAQVVARMPAAKIQDYLKKQILRQRQMQAVKAFSDKIKQGFRIKTFEDALLGTGKKGK